MFIQILIIVTWYGLFTRRDLRSITFEVIVGRLSVPVAMIDNIGGINRR